MHDASRTLRLLGLAFTGLGALLLVAAAFLLTRDIAFTARAQRAPGEVIGLQNNKPVVRFQAGPSQAVVFIGVVSSSPPAYRVGEKVTVLYDPRQPQDAKIDAFLERWFLVALFGGLALVFGSIGSGFLIFFGARARRIAWLKRFGQPVTARIVDVAQNRFVRINSRNPWQIMVEWVAADGRQQRAASAYLMDDPRPLLAGRAEAIVWIDPARPTRHWVDLDVLQSASTGAAIPAANPVVRRR